MANACNCARIVKIAKGLFIVSRNSAREPPSFNDTKAATGLWSTRIIECPDNPDSSSDEELWKWDNKRFSGEKLRAKGRRKRAEKNDVLKRTRV